MQLTARKREILRRVIEEYVATGQPVGSRVLVERSGPRRLVVDRARRARRARDARPADAPAHVRRSNADRERLPGLRRGARRHARGTARRARRRPALDARRDRAGAAHDDGHALGRDAAACARLGAVARDRVDPAHRGPHAAADERHGRRDHVDGRRDEAGVPARGAGRSRPRRLGGRVPRGAARRRAARLAHGSASARGARARAARARVPRAHRADAARGRRRGRPRGLRRRNRRARRRARESRRSRRRCGSSSSSSAAPPCSSS